MAPTKEVIETTEDLLQVQWFQDITFQKFTFGKTDKSKEKVLLNSFELNGLTLRLKSLTGRKLRLKIKIKVSA